MAETRLFISSHPIVAVDVVQRDRVALGHGCSVDLIPISYHVSAQRRLEQKGVGESLGTL